MKRNHFIKKRVLWFIAALLTLPISQAWSADETLTIVGSSVTWKATDGYGSGTGSVSTTASTSINLSWTDVLKSTTVIQLKKSSGLLKSTSYPSTNNTIKSITVTNDVNSAQLSGSTDGSSWTSIAYTSGTAVNVSSSGYKYFKVIPSSGAYCALISIVVVYTAAAACNANPSTGDASINGSFL